jgi:putative transposase
MAYTPRDESPGYHHVVTRGNNKRLIYKTDRDRIFFAITLNRIAEKYGWTIIAYCLMKNHYHLVIKVGERGLANGMCELNTAYAVNFNDHHGRINHLFGKRYWNRRLRTQRSFLNTVRYVVQNPRRAGGTRPLEAYAWSSYAATIGLAFSAIRLDRDALLELLATSPEAAIRQFRALCAEPVPPSRVGRQPP